MQDYYVWERRTLKSQGAVFADELTGNRHSPDNAERGEKGQR
jgi:hypothetical protein